MHFTFYLNCYDQSGPKYAWENRLFSEIMSNFLNFVKNWKELAAGFEPRTSGWQDCCFSTELSRHWWKTFAYLDTYYAMHTYRPMCRKFCKLIEDMQNIYKGYYKNYDHSTISLQRHLPGKIATYISIYVRLNLCK